ncbi:hypothetical protein MUGA111182_04150 [Mucilaginibacter galii]|uniref:Uncharacterized protein n=1 Tax=Mucilaginibacter galii TaxID=2005073 RepID=A0A917JAK2_9SPHI|nr:hypothetical protein [Mucilaginibacter galii]GGI50925.1 hypothetical protein GCM10011425_21370 [Mucilaginibacter galii]
MSSWIGEVAAAVMMGSLPFLFPYKPKAYVSTWQKRQLVAKYRKWDWLCLPLLFTVVPLMTWVFGQIFMAQYQWEIDDNPRILYQILPGYDAWYVPGVIVAFALIGPVMTVIYRLILKDKYADYELYSNLTHGIDARKIWGAMALLFSVAALVTIYFLNNYYIKIWNFKIEVNDLLNTKAKGYSFNQIQKITYVEYSSAGGEGSKLEEDPHYLVQFKDQYVWNTLPGWTNAGRKPEFIKFLSLRSGVKIDTMGVEGITPPVK